jgi:hypothetical protein
MMHAVTREPTAYERRAANAAGFLCRLKGVFFKWAPGAEMSEVVVGQGPNADRAESVWRHAGRTYLVTVQEVEDES